MKAKFIVSCDEVRKRGNTMKKMKRFLSVLLSAALMVGSLSTVAYADETPSNRPWNWVEEDGGVWRCYDAKGEPIKNQIVTDKQGSFYLDSDGNWVVEPQIITVNNKMYCINEDGEVRKDELFLVEYDRDDRERIVAFKDYDHNIIFNNGNGDGGVHAIMYAYPDGHLANRNWVMIEKDGHQMSYEVDQGDWYWFNKNGSAIRANQREINDAYFLFNPSGKMYQSQWVGTYGDDYYRIDDGYTNDAGVKNEYYSHFGDMVKNQYLYLDEDAKGPEGWYWFDTNGKGYSLDDLEAGTATPSNAQEIIDGLQEAENDKVLSINPSTDSVQVEVGEPVTLYYETERASASNASPLTKHHDVYVVRGFENNENPGLIASNSKVGKVKMEENGVVSVEFTAKAPGNVEVVLFIDDCEAAIEVESIMGTDVAASTEIVVDGLFKTSGTGMEVSGIKALQEITTDSAFEESKDTVINMWKSNKAKVSKLEDAYLTAEGMMTDEPSVSAEAAEKLNGSSNTRSANGGVSVVGAALAVASETEVVQLNVDLPENEESINAEFKDEYEKVTTLDITLLADGVEQSELPLPILVDVPIPTGFDPEKTEIYHIHEGEEPVKLDVTVNNGSASFAVDKLSTFVFAEKGGDSGINGGIGDSYYDNNDSYTSSSTSSDKKPADESKGVTTIDEKKGVVNTLTGIVTGEGDGYSKWVEEKAENGAVLWKLQYADGTMVGGKVVTKEDGTTYEQPAWEMVNGKWFAFDADGYADAGWVYDTELGGWFFIDINDGMKTGWQLVGGLWYFLQPVSDGKKGIMYADRWIDGWYVDASGAWDGKPQVR